MALLVSILVPVREDDAAGVDPLGRLREEVERSKPLRQIPELPLRLAVRRSHEPVERRTVRSGAIPRPCFGHRPFNRPG